MHYNNQGTTTTVITWGNRQRIVVLVVLIVAVGVLLLLVSLKVLEFPTADIGNEAARADKLQADLQIKARQQRGETGIIQVSGCVQQPDDWQMPLHSPIPEAIFVSIASYRDDECKDTVFDMFEKAARPELLFVGVVQQNKPDQKKEDCFDSCPVCAEKKRSGHIRVTSLSHLEARGPTYARYECSKLWRGEEFYLQIDSHTKFEPSWDDTLREQFRLTGDPNAAIGAYPPTTEQMEQMRANNFTTMITMCPGAFDDQGLPGIGAQVVSTNGRTKPVPSALLSAGMMFFPGKALYKVPYDPYLSYLFFGEEVLHSARLWTAGYNIYQPTKAFCTHHYIRSGKPRYWDDHSEAHACKKKAVQRAKYLLGAIDRDAVHPDYFLDIDKYGMGSERTLDAYLDFAGIDMKHRKPTKGCPKP
jgi:hypothetical protein